MHFVLPYFCFLRVGITVACSTNQIIVHNIMIWTNILAVKISLVSDWIGFLWPVLTFIVPYRLIMGCILWWLYQSYIITLHRLLHINWRQEFDRIPSGQMFAGTWMWVFWSLLFSECAHCCRGQCCLVCKQSSTVCYRLDFSTSLPTQKKESATWKCFWVLLCAWIFSCSINSSYAWHA